jgi:2-dehydro-3-deoxyphosphogluconate aldolase/(4S)-4-hydroxy-2-oxoglutarate aldolase
MNAVKERIYNCGIVPVVVLTNVEDAVPTAQALLAGGIDVLESTLRTSAGLDSIHRVASNCPEMMVGAGTVLTLEDCIACIDAGARFIVSPGLNEEVVKYCLEHNILPTPGCVTPTEITKAMGYGLDLLKFFPANIYGGIAALKALSGPFPYLKFIPTGGVDQENLAEFISAPNVFAVGGSWVCTKGDIANHEFERISHLAAESRSVMLGFELAHVGINCDNEAQALESAGELASIFNLPVKDGSSSVYAGTGFEFIKSQYLGEHGHLAIRTNDIKRAMAYLEARGYALNPEAIKSQNGKIIAAYLKKQVGGFAIHLQQK